MSDRPLLILNPASAAGRTGRRRDAITKHVQATLGAVDCVVTRAPGDARRLAAEAVGAGRERLLVGGGDGTASEVASGVLSRTQGQGGPAIGLLPLGSGGDLARTLGLPATLDASLALLRRGRTRRIDAGRLESPRPAYFVNEAGAGLSATTIRLVGRLAKRLGARAGFAAGAVAAILGHRPTPLRITVDGDTVHEGPTSLVVAANGRYFGAGMQVAPRADPADGRLEVVVVRGLAVPRLLVNLPSLFAGTHGAHPSVSFHAAKRVEIAAAGPAVDEALDIDGEEAVGLPLRASILPSALDVFVPDDDPGGRVP